MSGNVKIGHLNERKGVKRCSNDFWKKEKSKIWSDENCVLTKILIVF